MMWLPRTPWGWVALREKSRTSGTNPVKRARMPLRGVPSLRAAISLRGKPKPLGLILGPLGPILPLGANQSPQG